MVKARPSRRQIGLFLENMPYSVTMFTGSVCIIKHSGPYCGYFKYRKFLRVKCIDKGMCLFSPTTFFQKYILAPKIL